MNTDRSSEGPYSHEGNCSNPKCDACSYHRGYAEGRKAAEKEFKELLEITNCMAQMLKEIWAVYVPSRDPSFLVGFNAWKKARGLA